MNKREYAEFHKYLALLIYEYNKMLSDYNISDESRRNIQDILRALEEVMKICIIDGK